MPGQYAFAADGELTAGQGRETGTIAGGGVGGGGVGSGQLPTGCTTSTPAQLRIVIGVFTNPPGQFALQDPGQPVQTNCI